MLCASMISISDIWLFVRTTEMMFDLIKNTAYENRYAIIELAVVEQIGFVCGLTIIGEFNISVNLNMMYNVQFI